jgi:hypothetical protein
VGGSRLSKPSLFLSTARKQNCKAIDHTTQTRNLHTKPDVQVSQNISTLGRFGTHTSPLGGGWKRMWGSVGVLILSLCLVWPSSFSSDLLQQQSCRPCRAVAVCAVLTWATCSGSGTRTYTANMLMRRSMRSRTGVQQHASAAAALQLLNLWTPEHGEGRKQTATQLPTYPYMTLLHRW